MDFLNRAYPAPVPYIGGTKYLTMAEAARVLGVPRAHILAAIRDRKLAAHWHRYRLYILPGPAFAEAVERQEARAYHRETGICPYCGEPAVFHDPDRGGEAA